MWFIVGELGDVSIVSRMGEGKEGGCGGLQIMASRNMLAELTSQTPLRLTERNYIKDIIGEKCHMTPPPHHNILSFDVCPSGFTDLIYLFSTETRNTGVTIKCTWK